MSTRLPTAPSSHNQHIFNTENIVFYGTDDGAQDGSFSEFEEFEAFLQALPEHRTKNVHYASVMGGLYGLNLIPLWRPSEITFFDINPHAIAYFRLVCRVLTSSKSKSDFLARLASQDYDIASEQERVIRENIALKQRDQLPASRGSSKRSFEASWRYALDQFDLTKSLLQDVPVTIRQEGMESPSFQEFVREQGSLWIYCSNVFEFVHFKLLFTKPTNVVLLAIIYPGQPDLLDLAPLSKNPIEVTCSIPMQLRRIREFQLFP